MSADVFALLSIVVVVAFFAVLCGFLLLMARLLGTTADRLADVCSINIGIRADCDLISPAAEGMNLALYGVAANLSDLGDESELLPPSSAAAS